MKDIYWTSDDITFCVKKCNVKECERNKTHIKHIEIPHSYSDFEGTKYCIKERKEK